MELYKQVLKFLWKDKEPRQLEISAIPDTITADCQSVIAKSFKIFVGVYVSKCYVYIKMKN